jgi:DNA-binding beta-propeller fold protein YncE
VLYVADGDCNAIVSISNATSLLVKDEVTVGAGCKSFKCLYPSASCGKLVKSGSPLNKPFAAAILPNGNIVVANTGNNTLVELTPSGTVLGTKVIDKSKTPGIWGLYAIGTSDANTAIYYTDTNGSELHKLEQ